MKWNSCRDKKPVVYDNGEYGDEFQFSSEDVLLAWTTGVSDDPLETATTSGYAVGFYVKDEGWYIYDTSGSDDAEPRPWEPVFWQPVTDPFEECDSWEVDYFKGKREQEAQP